MSYFAFHGLFIVPPLLLLGWGMRGRMGRVHPRAGTFLGVMAAIALVYTTPWDNYLVREGVWSYGADRVVGTIGYVPVEEYLFFLLQPLLAGLWLYRLLSAAPVPAYRADPGRGREGLSAPASPDPGGSGGVRGGVRVIGGVLYAAAAVAGVLLLRHPQGTYLGLILAWAAPVLALQWAYAGGEIWARRGAWAAGVAAPTLYLWIADAVALRSGIWRISEAHTLGPALGPLPLEEAVFFLVTNLLVVQGLILFLYPPRRPSEPALGKTSAAAPEAVAEAASAGSAGTSGHAGGKERER